jgi:bacteriocin biosynthesis cyclodehydratase domain-containing protein
MSSGEQPADSDVFRLSPGAVPLYQSADELLILLPDQTVTFRVPAAVALVRVILGLVTDGCALETVIAKAASAAGDDVAVVRSVVAQLIRSGCIYSVGAETEMGSALTGFFATTGLAPRDALALLAAFPALVVVPEAAAPEIGRVCADARLAAVIHPVAPSTSSEAVATAVASAIAQRPAQRPIVALCCGGFAYRSAVPRELNKLSIERGKATLYAAAEGTVGRIGPFVIPRSNACLECLHRRWLGNAGASELRAAELRTVVASQLAGAEASSHPTLAGIVARLAALELVRIALGAVPVTSGGVLEVDYFSGVSVRRTVLKLPRCPACRRARPERLPWDITTGSFSIAPGADE